MSKRNLVQRLMKKTRITKTITITTGKKSLRQLISLNLCSLPVLPKTRMPLPPKKTPRRAQIIKNSVLHNWKLRLNFAWIFWWKLMNETTKYLWYYDIQLFHIELEYFLMEHIPNNFEHGQKWDLRNMAKKGPFWRLLAMFITLFIFLNFILFL